MPEEEKKKEDKEEKKSDTKEEKKKKEGEEKTDVKKKDEKKKEDDKIVLEARMDCESCRYKVYRAIIGYRGIEEITIDMKGQKVILKGKVDAKKLFETVKKKSGNRITKLISYPEPKKEEGKKDEKKKEPVDVTVVLKVQMHCSACTKKVEKAIWKIPDVYSVKVEGKKITIKGKDLDPEKVREEVEERSGKYAVVVPQPKKEQEKKEEAKKDDKKEKSDGDGSGDSKEGKKEGANGGKGGGKEGKKEGGNGGKSGGGGGGGGGSKEGKKEEADKKKDDEVKQEEKLATRAMTEYVYPPQYFSDENPNACVVM